MIFPTHTRVKSQSHFVNPAHSLTVHVGPLKMAMLEANIYKASPLQFNNNGGSVVQCKTAHEQNIRILRHLL